MALGIIREAFTCDFSVYPYTDVRGRQSVVRAFIDRLVATGMWSIVSEEIPTANFTVSTTYYRIYIKFKTNDHYIRFQVAGGSTDLTVTINITKAGIVGASYPLNYTGAITPTLTHSSLGYTQIGMCAVFGPTWMIVHATSYSLGYPVPATTTTTWFAGYVFEDFITPTTTTDIVMLQSTSTSHTMLSALGTYFFLSGDDYVKYAASTSLPPTAPDTEIIVPASGHANTNWRKVDIYGFSNSTLIAPTGTILSINGHYFIVVGNNLIADLGAIP